MASPSALMHEIDSMEEDGDPYGDGPDKHVSVGNVQLEFQDTSTHDDLGGSIDDSNDRDMLLPAPVNAAPSRESSRSAYENASCFSFDYYKRYFDVDTEQVLFRLKSSFWPLHKPRFIQSIEGKGDLYGPFWVATTLVFAIAFSGNIVDYKNSIGKGEQDVWRYDFDKVSLAATMIYGYISLVPFIVWVFMSWRLKEGPGLLDTFTLYGYSIFVYIPVSFLCIFPWIGSEIAWTSIVVALVVSGSVLVVNLHEALKANNDWKKLSPFLMAIGGAHFLLTIALKFYFFTHVTPKTLGVLTTQPPIPE